LRRTSQSAHLVSDLDPKSPVVEAYRTLRTNLRYASAGGELRSVLVTSPGPGEGKSTIAANLACVMARSGQRVITVGADLRRPTLRKYFGMEDNGRGLSNILVGEATLDDCLIRSSEKNLMVLTSGPKPPNPAELLETERMRTLVEELEERADMVIFDAPPVIAVTDALIIASLVDGVLLVINVGTVPRELAKRSKEQFDAVGARLLGVVLNRVDVREGYGYYYYYYEQGN
jgi:capsular exopolysaccharide synthesis family protein